MSGFAAVYHGDGRSVDPAQLRRMTDAVAHRGPDARGEWAEGPIGLGHRLLYTTPESLSERQPARDAAGECRLVWDGRLDNRDELIALLEGTEGEPVGRTDPDLVVGAYRRWGPACPARVLGDFSFALWDARRRRLLCGRDRLGLKPFHYAWDGTTLLVGSETRVIAAARGAMPEPDDEMVLAFLLREFRDGDQARSFFQGVRRLPPGHALLVEGLALRVERYWSIDAGAEVRYERDEQYVERFRELFGEAVRCRLRSYFPVGLFLSGGLDSSAIAATAARFADGDDAVPPLEAFTLYSADPLSDEREHARAVSDACGLKFHELDVGDRAPLDDLDGDVVNLESPVLGVGRRRDDENMDTIRARGCRVLLSGDGGDQLLDEIGYLADLLYALKPLRFLGEARALADWYGGTSREVVATAANCLAPPALKYWGKRLLRGVPPDWVNRDLARAVGLRARVRSPRVPVAFPSFAQAETYGSVMSPYYVLKLEVDERYASRLGIEFRYPFLDSRLVEFVLAIPSARRTRHGERKRILREATRGLVPDAVRFRRGKGDWTESMDRAVRELCRADPPFPLRNGSGRLQRYVDLRGARALIARYLAGRAELRWEVWSLVTLDRWLDRFWGNTLSPLTNESPPGGPAWARRTIL